MFFSVFDVLFCFLEDAKRTAFEQTRGSAPTSQLSTSQPLNFYSILFTPVSSVKPRRRFTSVWKL